MREIAVSELCAREIGLSELSAFQAGSVEHCGREQDSFERGTGEIDTGHSGRREIGQTQVRATARFGPARVALGRGECHTESEPGEIGRTEAGHVEVSLVESSATQVGPGEVHLASVRMRQVRLLQIRVAGSSIDQPGTMQPCGGQIAAVEDGFGQIRSLEIRSCQDRPRKVPLDQVGPRQLQPRQVLVSQTQSGQRTRIPLVDLLENPSDHSATTRPIARINQHQPLQVLSSSLPIRSLEHVHDRNTGQTQHHQTAGHLRRRRTDNRVDHPLHRVLGPHQHNRPAMAGLGANGSLRLVHKSVPKTGTLHNPAHTGLQSLPSSPDIPTRSMGHPLPKPHDAVGCHQSR